ncbi:MAG: flagellar biosynthesis protein FlhF [Lysobacteraceae bacterium]
MRIQRFQATDMRAALKLVREAQGPQAVILSSQRNAAGVEVVAAVDYDESLVRQAIGERAAPDAPQAPAAARPAAGIPAQATPLEPLRPAPLSPAGFLSLAEPFTPAAEARPTATAPAAPRQPTPTPATATAAGATTRPDPAQTTTARERAALELVARAPDEDASVSQMRRELGEMRQMIEREMARFTDERLRATPVRAALMDELAAYGCDAELTRSIISQLPADAERGRARGIALGLLAKSIVIPSPEPIEEGGVLALVGPTGVGKTTTIAKLAHRFAAQWSPRDVALVTTDTIRVGAREQLQHYGRMLGMPVIEIGREADLADQLDRLADYRLVLVDTAGLSHRDRALATYFQWLNTARRMRSYLVLPANGQAEDLEEIVHSFRGADPEGVILSKVDETARLGTALSVVIRHRLPLAYVTDGQQVPEDLQLAEGHRLALRLGELRRAARPHTNTERSDAVA